MRHLFRYQEAGRVAIESIQASDLTAKQMFDGAHRMAYIAEVVSYSKKLPPLKFTSHY